MSVDMGSFNVVECNSCGGMFNPQRNTRLSHYDSNRCAKCGHRHTVIEINNKLTDKERKRKSNRKVYLMRSGDNIKVGVSTSPQERQRQIQTSHYEEVELIKTWEPEDALSMEKKIHAKLFSQHQRGEWFKMDEKSLNGIVNAISLFVGDTED